MAKRKREAADGAGLAKALKSRKAEVTSSPKQVLQKEAPAGKSKDAANGKMAAKAESRQPAGSTGGDGEAETTSFQIITGSYERVLHGFLVAIPRSLVTGHDGDASTEAVGPKINFSDTFLFNAHASAIRCLALSPPSDESSKVLLATGSTDERINLYYLSTAPPRPSTKPQLPTLHGTSITENSKNKELGSLLHHSSTVSALYFPSRSKLLSSAEDNTIAITRTRDWTPLSTIRAPIPKPQGRPSGDTAGPGEVPSGINDFAVHPSMKMMISVGKGEKCMRLWNLVTGRKAGVLTFTREMLESVGEGRFGSGEGRRIEWDEEGEEFAVAFERGAVVFGIDSKPKAKVVPTPRTKVHQVHYPYFKSRPNTLLVSTEDGRIMLYDTKSTTPTSNDKDDIPSSNLIAQIGGPAAGITGRIKDFEILPIPDRPATEFLTITGSSDGTVRFWTVNVDGLKTSTSAKNELGFAAKQVGRLLGTYSTSTRITCLKAFAMTGTLEATEEEEEVVEEKELNNSSEDSDEEA